MFLGKTCIAFSFKLCLRDFKIVSTERLLTLLESITTHSFLGLPRGNTWKILKTIGFNFHQSALSRGWHPSCPQRSQPLCSCCCSEPFHTDTHCSAVPPGTHCTPGAGCALLGREELGRVASELSHLPSSSCAALPACRGAFYLITYQYILGQLNRHATL